MRNKIIISEPFIKEEKNSEIFGESVKLCANITMINPNTLKKETKECYFEFEKRFKKYLCYERSDAFVSGLLSSAMECDMDIEFTSPISERLYYGLTTYYIPMVSENNPTYPMHNIKISGPLDSTPIKSENKVATGCSGGVDSFYTIARYSEGKVSKEMELTHLIYSSTASVDNDEKRMRDVFKKNNLEVKQIAKECNLEEIACYSNLYEFYKFPYKSFITFFTPIFASIPFALQKLISIYYANSGGPISEFNLDISKVHGFDPSVFDIFTLSCIDNENLKFYSAGLECERMDKEKYISDFRVAQKHLSVCSLQALHENPTTLAQNCSFCYKCLRTMCHFYAFGKLSCFKEVFNVDEFMMHKTKYIGKMMGEGIKHYVIEFKNEAKKNNVKIPIASYFYAYLWYRPIKILRKTFSNSLLARKIYYKFNLDYKLDGYRGPYYSIYKDKINGKNKE